MIFLITTFIRTHTFQNITSLLSHCTVAHFLCFAKLSQSCPGFLCIFFASLLPLLNIIHLPLPYQLSNSKPIHLSYLSAVNFYTVHLPFSLHLKNVNLSWKIHQSIISNICTLLLEINTILNSKYIFSSIFVCWPQGCISCGILLSGIGARGVTSEHMENMEMFSCSPS